MKKDKFPIITALELINKKKLVFGFHGVVTSLISNAGLSDDLLLE